MLEAATTSARPISPPPRTPMAAPKAKAMPRPAPSPQRVAAADLLVHVSDDPARDLLEGAEDVAFVGGFAAAAAMLGRNPDLVMLDMTDPRRPRARSLSAALARIVRARAINPRFIAGQMRHGPRGAAELAETVDRLVDFARPPMRCRANCSISCTTPMSTIPGARFSVARESAAARAIAERLERRAGRLWHHVVTTSTRASRPPRGGCRMNAPRRSAAAAVRRGAARAFPHRWRPATVCWPGCRRSDRRSRSMPSSGCARRRAGTATASSRLRRAVASRSAA